MNIRWQDVTQEDFEILQNLGTNRWQARADQNRDSAIMSILAFDRVNRPVQSRWRIIGARAYPEHYL